MANLIYPTVLVIHVCCAVISVLGFTVRGYLTIQNRTAVTGFVFKKLPHIIDTVLLATAIILVILTGQYPLTTPWVTAKIIALLVYIGFGICLMRLAKTRQQQLGFFLLALTAAGYIILVALTKSPLF